MERLVTYNGSDGYPELAIRVTLDECYDWGGFGICDLCNDEAKEYMYLCPELGSKALCQKCFDEHKTRVKLYKSDIEFMEYMLNDFVRYYKLSFTDDELKQIKAFIKQIKELNLPDED